MIGDCVTCGAPLELDRAWEATASGVEVGTISTAMMETVRCAAGHRYDVVADYGPDRPA